HVHNDPEELGRVYQPDLAIAAGMGELAKALAAMPAPESRPWAEATRAAHADYLAWREPVPNAGALQMAEVVHHLRAELPDDAIVCNGAGNYNGWVNRFFPYRGFRTQLAPVSGSMGYGLPAAIAAKLVHPGREAVAFAGDGCFLMTGQELATAVQYGIDVKVVVMNNGYLGMVRQWQEMFYERAYSEVDISVAPDFVKLAEAYGAAAFRAAGPGELAGVLAAGLNHPGVAVIEVLVSKEENVFPIVPAGANSRDMIVQEG
ncbi:MAG TPA: thiamine pyrophosphate-dependent enzyme, partial [Pyrinomonadaceae bacterium]